jgi:hypothetical protein
MLVNASRTSFLVVLFLDDGGPGSYRGGAVAVAVGAVAVGDLDPRILVDCFAEIDGSVQKEVTDSDRSCRSGEVDRRYLLLTRLD